MSNYPHGFPPAVLAALFVAVLCFTGALLVGVLAVARWWRARRAPARPGYLEDSLFWPPRSERWFR